MNVIIDKLINELKSVVIEGGLLCDFEQDKQLNKYEWLELRRISCFHDYSKIL